MVRLCAALEVRPSGYYAWLRRQARQASEPGGGRRRENEVIVDAMRAIEMETQQRYGSPRMRAALARRGLPCNHKRVARLMRVNGIRAVNCKRRRRAVTTQSQHDLPVAANVLNREFTAQGPDEKWVSDITYILTAEGWLYLAIVLDLFSRRVVGYAMDTNVTTQLPVRALNMALETRQPTAGLLHHSDRGSQYASYGYQAILQRQAIQPSMSRTGDCYDNAVMESFFSTFKAELIGHRQFASIAEARAATFLYIEQFYNPKRLHSTLGYLSPDEFEQRYRRGA